MIKLRFPGAVLLLSLALWLLAAGLTLPVGLWVWPWTGLEALSGLQIQFAHGLMPRPVVAVLVGAALGLAGALMQMVLRNPLADPSTLGVSAAAQLALVAATVLAPGLLAPDNGPVALAGAAAAACLVMALGLRRDFAPVTVTVAGMLVGMLASAIATALVLGQGHYLLSLVIWSGGSLAQDSWHDVSVLLLVLLLAAGAAAVLRRPLAVMGLGGAAARALGARVGWIRAAALALAVVLSAAVAAQVGLVGFVGLAAPALARQAGIRGTGPMLWAAPLAGALLLSLTDSALLLLAALGGPELPTGALTGLLGGPLLIALLPRLAATVPPGTEGGDILRTRAPRPRLLLALLAGGTLIFALLSLWYGRGPGGWGGVAPAFAARFLPLRATAILAAAGAGALLALSGAALQRLTANPMAAPEVLGVTGGASLGYAAAVFVLPAPGPVALAIASGGGGALALLLLALYALRADMAPARLLLAGLAVGALASALLAIIMASGDPRGWSLLGWLSGSATRATLPGALALGAAAALALAGAVALARWIEILPLGAPVARGLGLPLSLARLVLILGAGLATGAACVLTGPVSFVGLMAPHIARSLGLARPVAFLTGSWLCGAALMVLAAFGARTLTYPYDLPLGLIATLVGAPWLFLALIRRSRA